MMGLSPMAIDALLEVADGRWPANHRLVMALANRGLVTRPPKTHRPELTGPGARMVLRLRIQREQRA